MELSTSQFPQHGFNPFAWAASKLGTTKTHGLVSNQEHEGQRLEHAVIQAAVQHHLKKDLATHQAGLQEQAAQAHHGRQISFMHAVRKGAEPLTPINVHHGDVQATFTARAPRAKAAKGPETPKKSAPKLVSRGSGGRFTSPES